MPFDPNVHVGTAAWITRGDKILLMKRANVSHGGGSWALPGGWVDFGEDPAFTIAREVKEEVGIDVLRTSLMSVVANTWEGSTGPGHVVCVTYEVAIRDDDEPRIMEPDKCIELMWATITDLMEMDARNELFPATKSVLQVKLLDAVQKWTPPPYDLYDLDEDAQVCWKHGAVNVCRRGSPRDKCEWRYDAPSGKRVREYQSGEREHWMDWKAGDPCGACGSTDTWEDPVEGGQCNGCGGSDSDE